MATKNDITGDSIQSRKTSKEYLDNYDKIFGKKNKNKISQDTMGARKPLRRQSSPK